MAEAVAFYPYTNEHGEYLYEKVRTDPKGFFVRRPGPNNRGWVYTLGGGNFTLHGHTWKPTGSNDDHSVPIPAVEPVLYNLPLIKQRLEQPIIVVEGEKDADVLAELGFVATTSGGAGTWKWDFGKHLTGRRVVVIPDRDNPGEEYGCMVAACAIAFRCESLRIVEDGFAVPLHGDISDWLRIHHEATNRHGKRQAIINLIRRQEEWKRHKTADELLGTGA